MDKVEEVAKAIADVDDCDWAALDRFGKSRYLALASAAIAATPLEEYRKALEVANVELAALIMNPNATGLEWPVLTGADHECLTKAYRAIRTALNQSEEQ